ncbi:MAG: c-type cytochrome [Pseudohongiellaceae bacterium]
MYIAIVIVVLVAATLILHFASPWWLTPLASNWSSIDTTIEISFWITGFVFIAVNLFLAWVVWRYRHNKSRRSHYEPENKKLELWLTGLTTLGVVAMLTPGLIVWANIVHVPDDAMEVEAIGQQWQWTYRFPGEDGVLGTANPRFVSNTNRFGLDPEDPKGDDDILIEHHRLHLPLDQPVKLVLRSNDVLHNFAVPQFRVKMDLVPGTQTYQWFTPTREGTFDVMCEELCGLAHYTMKGQVQVESEQEFQNWLASYPTFGDVRSNNNIDLAIGEQQYQTCVACHGADGSGNADLNAPNLSRLDARYMARQMRHYREGIRGTEREDSPGATMIAIAQGTDTDTEPDLLAYIESLSGVDVDGTLEGDITNGQRLYGACAACHGASGEGKVLLSAPALAGQSDLYLKRQLEHFSMGWRGKHPQDQFGTQMRLMTRTIHSPERLRDLLAYIATL